MKKSNLTLPEENIECELMVIGAGLAGMASALFAANRGISTVQTGIFGEILFASGLMDLMGVYPISEGKIWDDPFAAIEMLKKDQSDHPYAKVDTDDIYTAMDEVLSFLGEAGLSYKRHEKYNANVITQLGTVKQTWCVPETMWNGVTALSKKAPCLLIDFQGLKGFSAKQVEEVLKKNWPGLHSTRIAFPGIGNADEIYAEQAARHLELGEHRKKFAQEILPHIQNIEYIGFPSIFGVSRTEEVFLDLQDRLGVKIFEIPGLPPSLNGMRLMEAFKAGLPNRGVETLYQKKVIDCFLTEDNDFLLHVGAEEREVTVKAKNIILATGRFFGKGLYEHKNRLMETLFDLPVCQPGSRNEWYKKDLLDPEGHEINNAGIETDNMFRPIDEKGRPVFKRLFAAGSILAHNDWKRTKSGSGLAITSGFSAVKAIMSTIKEK